MAEEKKVSEEELVDKYQKHFDANIAYRLLKKLRKATRGKPKIISGSTGLIVEVLGKLISALDNPEMPGHYKALCVGAIGYIILPLDLIPDITPVIGYGDDLASAAGVVAAVSAYSSFSMQELDNEINEEENEMSYALESEIQEQNLIEDKQQTESSNSLETLENFIPEV